MWISKEEWRQVREKINNLENAVARLEFDTQIWVSKKKYQGIFGQGRVLTIGNFRQSDNITLKAILELLLKKLNLKIDYKECQPPATTLVKQPKEEG